MEVGNLNIYAAAGLIVGVCFGAFVMVLAKIAVKESRRITHRPSQIDLNMPSGTGPATEQGERGIREGAALQVTSLP